MTTTVEYLRSPAAIRERAENILAAGLRGELAHFSIDLGNLGRVADEVIITTRERYPTLAIPYHSRWGHFRVGGVDRITELASQVSSMDPLERARTHFDLAVTSVLLDAGAGPEWRYREAGTGGEFARSEGLAVASFRMFAEGAFSSDEKHPLRADAAGLENVTTEVLAKGFQVADGNPLVGLGGRASLLRGVAHALRDAPHLFGKEHPRVGNLVDHLQGHVKAGELSAATVFEHVVGGFSGIWPGRIEIDGENLGDVWPHPRAGGEGPSAGLVPFHKLSQWLTYSLIEPLEWLGIRVIDLDALTGLPEYRNGGLFIDLEVLAPKHAGVTEEPHTPASEIIVEWRALTVALLDRVATTVRERLGLSSEELPLAKVLEGGTWAAGRRVAKSLRPDGAPPIRITSDGTVF